MIAPALRPPDEFDLELPRLLDRGRSHAICVELPAPVAPGLGLFDGPEEEASYYESHGELLLVGLGVARQASASGPQRFERVRAALAPELERLRGGPQASRVAGRPIALGGFAFEEELSPSSIWSRFGAARLVIPRWLYRVEKGRATLSRVVEVSEGSSLVRAEYEALLGRLEEGPSFSPVGAAPIELGANRSTEEKIRAARSLIRDRVFEKVVLAEKRQYALSPEARPVHVLEGLGAPELGTVRFGFRCGEQAFVGATPERLVAKRGGRLETEAVAGSVVWDGTSTEGDLLASQKDLDEQGFVVRFIHETLAGLSAQVVVSAVPQIRRLTHVGHLVTRVQAEVDADLHLLEVGRRLHPTPAVAGTPTEAALEHIRRFEGFERGWYAGAIGWFDAQGDGELRVALRSGLVEAGRAHLFAGADIVADSVPARELAEIQSKHRRMMDAIGASS